MEFTGGKYALQLMEELLNLDQSIYSVALLILNNSIVFTGAALHDLGFGYQDAVGFKFVQSGIERPFRNLKLPIGELLHFLAYLIAVHPLSMSKHFENDGTDTAFE